MHDLQTEILVFISFLPNVTPQYENFRQDYANLSISWKTLIND